MPETPRSSFRLTAKTRKQIEEIRQVRGGLYGYPSRTRVVELAVDHLHQEICRPVPARPASPSNRSRNRS